MSRGFGRARRLGSALALLALAVLAGAPATVSASTADTATTLSPTGNKVVRWHGTLGAGAGGGNELTCSNDNVPPVANDDFRFELQGVDAAFYQAHSARLVISIKWSADDYNSHQLALTSWVDDGSHTFNVSDSATRNAGGGPGFAEITYFDPGPAASPKSYVVGTCTTNNISDQDYEATAVLTVTGTTGQTTTGTQAFANYFAPDGLFTPPGASFAFPSAGEPTIGVVTSKNAVMYGASVTTARITFDDTKSPPTATWVNKTPLQHSLQTLDSILFTDRDTGRTFFSQLNDEPDCSLTSYTDDAGDTWNPTAGCGMPGGHDHQSIGGGPFVQGVSSLNGYKNAVYYCAQSNAFASCSVSQDGGVTYNSPQTPAPIPMYTVLPGVGDCLYWHGHIKVGPDGTAYVPHAICGLLGSAVNGATPHQGLVVSTDSGRSWTVKQVQSTSIVSPRGSDPHVGVGAKGTVYYGYQDGDSHARIVVSHDRGDTWTDPIDVGKPFGIQNVAFPEVIVGDDDRAAFAFIGTSTPGDMQKENSGGTATDGFAGTWYLFIAFTYDGGKTWQTVNATPNDPVQRGCVWLQGGSHPCRNMLDFNDIAIDATGRVLVAYTDGCIAACVTDNTKRTDSDFAALPSLVRQVGGVSLFASCSTFAAGCPPVSKPAATAATDQLPSTVTAHVPTSGAGWLDLALVGASSLASALFAVTALKRRRT